MNNFIIFPIIAALGLFTFSAKTEPSTKAIVTIVGAKIKSEQKTPIVVKYKRKDCPVCKGKGWYMSGDGIKKIECTYCEPNDEKSK